VTYPKRGEIVRVSFPNDGDQPRDLIDDPHPAIVLQNDGANERFDTTIVIPLTTGSGADRIYEVEVRPPKDEVDNPSLAQLTQLMVVSIPEQIKEDYDQKSAWCEGEVHEDTLNDIENQLNYVLGI